MPATILAMLLALQLMLCAILPASASPSEAAVPERLFFGLVDPELSGWFARLPAEDEEHDKTILWDWSWRGFLASLFGQPLTKEADGNALCS